MKKYLTVWYCTPLAEKRKGRLFSPFSPLPRPGQKAAPVEPTGAAFAVFHTANVYCQTL